MEPQRLDGGGFPHVAQFALPRARIAAYPRPEAPARAHRIGRLPRDDARDGLVHRLIARAGHDHIGRHEAAILEPQPARLDPRDPGARDDADLARGNQFRGADIDVIARSRAQGLHHQAAVILAEIEREARGREAGIEIGVARPDLAVKRDLLVGEHPERVAAEIMSAFSTVIPRATASSE